MIRRIGIEEGYRMVAVRAAHESGSRPPIQGFGRVKGLHEVSMRVMGDDDEEEDTGKGRVFRDL